MQKIYPLLFKPEDPLIRNPNYLLLLAVFNAALLMNFHDQVLNRKVITIAVLLMVIFNLINYRLWWAGVVTIFISSYIFTPRFPRIPNHCNIEVLLYPLILGLLYYKLLNRKFSIPPHLVNALFRITLVTVYFYTGFHKLNTAFMDTEVSCVNSINETVVLNFSGVDYEFPHYVSTISQFATLFLEMILPFGLLFHTTRKWTAIIFLAFHFYLSFTVFAAFGAFAAFMILGCLLDFSSFEMKESTVKAFRIYLSFILCGFFTKFCLIRYGANVYTISFINGSIFNIGYAIFFYFIIKNYPQKQIGNIPLRQKWILATVVVLISCWTLKSYIGLGNAANLTMYSNLVTEKSRSNHLFIDTKKTKVFNFEEDNLLVVELPEPLKKHKFEGYKLPLIEFRFLSSQWCEKYHDIKLPCRIVYKNDTIAIDDLHKSEFSKSEWWYKYVYFRKIQPEGANKCYW
ncbi:hypothetical protein [Flavobacterium sp. 3HN19-14]|uniref:hypothetical protein n=1 Tax=Flavobacterium sp. 3HN19-14 TaxID=3448133 RepID=UPI003EE281E3